MLRAVGDIILVEELALDKKTGSLITLEVDTPFKAKVISVGDTVEINVKTGDVVILNPYSLINRLRDHGCLYINSGSIIAVEE